MKSKRRYVLKNIVWDVDDDFEVKLPSKMTLDVAGSGLQELTEEQLEDYGFADWLTDRTGWCVRSFDWERAKAKRIRHKHAV